MQVFTDEFKELIKESKRLILSDDQSSVEGSISHDDLERLKRYLKWCDDDIINILKACDEAKRVYSPKKENTLTDIIDGSK